FDVSTNARPEEVKALFRNCRLIGRRFRLAHIHFGREIIEVATFRAQAGEMAKGEDRLIENGMILRDNVFGTVEEDAWRRDFTVNALYYNIEDFSVVDYTGGMADLKAGVLRLIGDPEVRYREDPVRMLRAVRFAAKLGFRIEPATETPIWELGHLLEEIPPARLFEEVLKLLLGGCAVQTYELLRHYNLFGHLFPDTEVALSVEEEGFPHLFVLRALENTDSRLADNKPVTPAFLFAALLWEPVRAMVQRLREAQDMTEIQALQVAGDEVLAAAHHHVVLPRRFAIQAREIWQLQPRLERFASKRAQRLLEHPRFRAAYDFLLLRAEAGEDVQEAAEWWTHFQEAEEAERAAMCQGGGGAGKRRRKPRRRRRSKKPQAEA
ncbi:MAG: polynucleotide adenylyltransferase PcnB, partial [Gammaproteobacteria bacterium]